MTKGLRAKREAPIGVRDDPEWDPYAPDATRKSPKQEMHRRSDAEVQEAFEWALKHDHPQFQHHVECEAQRRGLVLKVPGDAKETGA